MIFDGVSGATPNGSPVWCVVDDLSVALRGGAVRSDDGRMRGSFSARLSQHPADGVVRDPTPLDNVYGTLQWPEKIEDLDQENRALTDLNRAILLEIAELKIPEEDKPNAA
jgi:hypothetical protein